MSPTKTLPARKSLVSDIPDRDGKTVNFLHCIGTVHCLLLSWASCTAYSVTHSVRLGLVPTGDAVVMAVALKEYSC